MKLENDSYIFKEGGFANSWSIRWSCI